MSDEDSGGTIRLTPRPSEMMLKETALDQGYQLLNLLQIEAGEGGIEGNNQKVQAVLSLQDIWGQVPGDLRNALKEAACERLDISHERLEWCLSASPDDIKDALLFRAIKQTFRETEMEYPLKGFIGRYIDYAQYSQAHLGYHFWAGLMTLGAACRRQFLIDADKLSANLYILLEGEAGTFKTSALRTSRDIFRHLCRAMENSSSSVTQGMKPYEFPAQMTQRSLLTEMKVAETSFDPGISLSATQDPASLEHVGAVYVGEMTDLLSDEQAQSSKMAETLTSMYDGDFDEGTQMHGRNRYDNVALSILMCSTMTWLRESMTPKSFQGGFMGGRVLAFSKGKSGRYYSRPVHLDPMARDELVKELVGYATHERTYMEWRPDAAAFFDELYPTLDKHSYDDRIGSYYNRRQVHLRKLALLMSLNMGHQPWIELEDIETAWELMKYEEPSMIACFTSMLSSEGKQIEETIHDSLVRSGGNMARFKLHRLLSSRWVDKKYLIDSVVEQMINSGTLGVRQRKGPSQKGRPSKVFYLTAMEDEEGNKIHNPETGGVLSDGSEEDGGDPQGDVEGGDVDWRSYDPAE